VGVAVLVLLVLAVRHHVGWHRLDAWGLAVSLPIGAVLGATLPSAVRYVQRHRTPLAVWDRLNEEFISYTHTGWCKNLETLIRQGGMLSGDLASGDREALEERWHVAHEHFYSAVLPKLGTIAELGSLLDATRPMGKDLSTGLRRMARARKGSPEEIAAGARGLRQTADRLAAAVETRLSCRVDTAMRTAWRAMIPELEERGVTGELDTDAVAGMRVRIREHELVMILQDLLRNAVEAAANRPAASVRLTASADLRRVVLEILDSGPGLEGRDPAQLSQAGFTTKAGGSGYGLFHAVKTLGIYRATLKLSDRPEGGLAVVINLMRPLHARGDHAGATHD
jgi:signal transduction histidine kinase